MVSVSHETDAQIERRLLRVAADAELRFEPGEWVFAPIDAPVSASTDALAIVRYDEAWCDLRPARAGDDGERFVIWRFAFPDSSDNSGFVGWLATRLKRAFGTGVFVTCGSHPDAGGVFDYWGAPVTLRGEVTAEIERLRSGKR